MSISAMVKFILAVPVNRAITAAHFHHYYPTIIVASKAKIPYKMTNFFLKIVYLVTAKFS